VARVGSIRGSRTVRQLALSILLGTGALAWLMVLVSCGYVALPFGWTINFPGFTGDAPPANALQEQITLPPGFSLDVYAAGMKSPRLLLFTETGDLLVSTPRQDKVWLVARDGDGDGRADGTRVLLDKLYLPHGLAYRDGWLYVAETDAVLRVRFDPATGSVSGSPERFITGLPARGNHWSRTVRIGPDGKLYVTVGSSCNVCIEETSKRAAMLRYNLDGSGEEIYANGLRNAVDFAWQPGTGALYATDNGRDLLGDDFPPCELNRVVAGGFYGWPFANGNRVPDPDLGAGHEAQIAASIPPAHGFGAHTAPLGIAFYEPPAGGSPAAFPAAYHGAAFVAEHGSWNRSRKSGYQVVALHFRPDGSIVEEPFITGFMRDEKVSGRPVGVAVGPDGALYVSDDYTGTIYRIAYSAAGARNAAQGQWPTASPDPLVHLDTTTFSALRARGEGLWNANGCAACHVAGPTPAVVYRPLAGLGERHTIDSLVAFLRSPPPAMPTYPLSDQQRRDLAVYLLATYP